MTNEMTQHQPHDPVVPQDAPSSLASDKPDVAEVVEGLRLAIRALNAAPSFDTRLSDPKRPGRSLSSYALLPQLEAILRRCGD